MKMRGKVLKGLCILFMVIVVLAGCQKSADNAVQRVESPETGLVFQISKEYLDQGTIMIEGPYKDYNENDMIQVVWYYTPITDKLFEEAKALSSEDLTVEKMEKLYEQSMEGWSLRIWPMEITLRYLERMKGMYIFFRFRKMILLVWRRKRKHYMRSVLLICSQ